MSEKRETSLKLRIDLKSGRITEIRDSASLTNGEERKKRKLDISSSSGSDSNAKQGDGLQEAASTEDKPRMSEKRDRDSASFTNEEARKKKKQDISSSSGSDSNAKQGDGSEDAIKDSPASAIVHNVDSLSPLMEKKLRDKANTDSSSLNIHGQHSQTEKMGSPSSSLRESPSSSREEKSPGLIDAQGESSERKLVYTKKLTYGDIYYGRMMIPVECAAELFPGLKRRIILPVMDSKRQLWDIEALFDELSYCYRLRANWNTFVNEHGLRPEDTIFFYQDPKLDFYLIEYEKRGGDGQRQG